MIPIWLVRHGEAAAAWSEHPDPSLSALGQQQAAGVADRLLGQLPPDVQLLSSPKIRARETALPLAQQLNREVSVVNAYQEIQAPVPLPERQRWLRSFMTQTWTEQSAELWQWRQAIMDSLHALERPTVVFTHFLVINTVVSVLRDHPETVQFWPDNGSCHRFVLDTRGLVIDALGQEMATRVN